MQSHGIGHSRVPCSPFDRMGCIPMAGTVFFSLRISVVSLRWLMIIMGGESVSFQNQRHTKNTTWVTYTSIWNSKSQSVTVRKVERGSILPSNIQLCFCGPGFPWRARPFARWILQIYVLLELKRPGSMIREETQEDWPGLKKPGSLKRFAFSKVSISSDKNANQRKSFSIF